MGEHIVVRGAKEHNLKDLDVDIPRGAIVAVTGVSGSGKSSLAFDTVFREGQRRYLESLSAFARQFLGKLSRPEVDHLEGLSPAIALGRNKGAGGSRSTVGTMSEIHDYLRVLMARAGNANHPENDQPLRASLFSFNSVHGACPACNGLGVEDQIDPDLLIADPNKTLRQGALVPTTPTGYVVYSQVTVDVLNQVCEAHGFNVDIPWRDLTAAQREVVFNGSTRLKVPFGKHPLESRLKWSGITAKPREEGYYKGLIPVMADILKRDRNKNIMRFASSVTCSACSGTRLRTEARAVRLGEFGITDLLDASFSQLGGMLVGLKLKGTAALSANPLIEAVQNRLALLQRLGLNYLAASRPATSLSGGELQRIRLATQLGTGLHGVLYVLDEPAMGLHARDKQRLQNMLENLRDEGSSILTVEHDEASIRAADWLLDIGPGAGVHGGELLYQGPPDSLERSGLAVDSRTAGFLAGESGSLDEAHRERRKGGGLLLVKGARAWNLKDLTVGFPLGVFNVVTGVSGSGKSTLVDYVLARALRQMIHGALTRPGAHDGIEGFEAISKIIHIDQSPIGRTPRSNPATYTGVFDPIRNLFAALSEARTNGLKKGDFSMNVPGGRCETCHGAGSILIGMHGLADVEVLCETCEGRRFQERVLAVRYKGKNILDVLNTSVEEACDLFEGEGKITRMLTALNDVGLGYIQLGQSAMTLSGGEAQRVKLASELGRTESKHGLYILDEPTAGLHMADVQVLLIALNRLVDKGNTVIAVEHHLDVVKAADHIIDMGPESGDGGGRVVVSGTPEQVAACGASHTGRVLAAVLRGEHPMLERREPKAAVAEDIRLFGVSTHNLKDLDVTIPRGKLTVVTGVSGSGKSSLAFDTLLAESQRRFAESLSTYARRYMSLPERAALSGATGLTPAVAIGRKRSAGGARATVGTLSEVYDYFRLVFSRAGVAFCPECHAVLDGGCCPKCDFRGDVILTARSFSFNHHQGACPTCKGLGAITGCDPLKLVTDGSRPLLDGAMDGHKIGRFYGERKGQHLAILRAVGAAHGVDFEKPWDGLDERAKSLAMEGTGDRLYQAVWHYERKGRSGSHEWETTWPGFAFYINEEYARKSGGKKSEAVEAVLSEKTCPACAGARLKPVYLAVRFAGHSVAEWCCMPIARLLTEFRGVLEGDWDSRTSAVMKVVHQEIIKRLEVLGEAGLGYLTLERAATTLSGGELQRIRLGTRLAAGLCGVTYVLDEPTVGLHARDTDRLIAILKRLRDNGNTVVVVEHDGDVIRAADHVIDMGPGAGPDGGRIVASGTPKQLETDPASPTGRYLAERPIVTSSMEPVLSQGRVCIRGARVHHLKELNVMFPAQALVAVTGVSGSGKSSLVNHVLAATAALGAPVGCDGIEGLALFDEVLPVDRKPLRAGAVSCPATYLGVFDGIRREFAATADAKARRLKAADFSFNGKSGGCETCQGFGVVRTRLEFLADVEDTCETCNGRRYRDKILACRLRGASIADVLAMNLGEARAFFAGDAGIAEPLAAAEKIGLSYLKMGQGANTLSGGEAQRLKLAKELVSGASGKGRKLFLFDEPTTGLHFQDVDRLMVVLRDLVKMGHGVVVVEHHLSVIKSADWVIDLGPEGGPEGGELIFSGSPADLMHHETSYTGAVLRRL